MKGAHAAPAARDDDLTALLEAPPVLGAEYITSDLLRGWWSATMPWGRASTPSVRP